MNIKIQNLDEAVNYINNKKDDIYSELIFKELMKHPPKIRSELYKILTEKEEYK